MNMFSKKDLKQNHILLFNRVRVKEEQYIANKFKTQTKK